MAVTTEYSTEITALDQDGYTPNGPTEQGGVVRVAHFNFTQGGAAGDAGSLAVLCQMPSSRVRLLGIRAAVSALGASRTMDFGHLGYTQPDDTEVAADPDGFDADNDVSSAIVLDIQPDVVIEAKAAWRLTTQVNDGTIPAGATIKGYALYVRN